MNTRINIWRWLCWPVDIAAFVILLNLGLTWWQAVLLLFVPMFFNYLDGLWRGADHMRRKILKIK